VATENSLSYEVLDDRTDRAVGAIDAMGFEGHCQPLRPSPQAISSPTSLAALFTIINLKPGTAKRKITRGKSAALLNIHFFLQVFRARPFLVAGALSEPGAGTLSRGTKQ
jgi:hypothetical protein